VRTEERIALLDEASCLMETAAAMVVRASEGTTAEISAERMVSAIREMISGDESIGTLRKNIMHDGDTDPPWTRPLVSVKNVHRRDI
jgi:hypothetical protein